MKQAKLSNNAGAKNLESFMDNAYYKELFDDIYFNELERVLDAIDAFEDEQQDTIDELQNEILDLKEQINLLESELSRYE